MAVYWWEQWHWPICKLPFTTRSGHSTNSGHHAVSGSKVPLSRTKYLNIDARLFQLILFVWMFLIMLFQNGEEVISWGWQVNVWNLVPPMTRAGYGPWVCMEPLLLYETETSGWIWGCSMAYSILIHSSWGSENKRNNNIYVDLTMGPELF